jgi:hypothetical protein
MRVQSLRQALELLLQQYANDKNSSTIRENVTLLLAGYDPGEGRKLGYNGTRAEEVAEAKPVNVSSDGGKLNGGGNFSDLTPERLKKYLAEPHLNMLMSGFVDGHLVYILEFPFSCESFVAELARQLERQFPGGRREPGRYLRSASFSFKHYGECPKLKVDYVTPRLDEMKGFLTGALYGFLQS